VARQASGATPQQAGAPATQVRGMFARIASTYDLLNHLLSAGRDAAWRRVVASRIDVSSTHVLDLCAGTGDLALQLKARLPEAFVCAGDFCFEMLDRGRSKGLPQRTPPATVDALQLPFADASFDALTVAFGVRNFEDLSRGLQEMARVLRPGGQLAVLEFFRSESRWRDLPFRLYFRHVLPRVGRLVSRDDGAYTYLPESVRRFVTRPEFTRLLHEHGFADVQLQEMTLGIATLFLARRRSDTAGRSAMAAADLLP
jgi:demethylmenaquinone methyltransferase/2-methoxy-6-polyprenyl-1,4-benzoquinol methylase